MRKEPNSCCARRVIGMVMGRVMAMEKGTRREREEGGEEGAEESAGGMGEDIPNCMLRKALQKRCCSGLRDSMASLNSYN